MNENIDNIKFAAIAVDVVVFGVYEDKLMVLLDVVNRPPHYVNVKGFPGGLITPKETAEEAVARHLRNKVNLNNIFCEQLYTFSEVNRDKRNRVISTAYLSVVRPDVVGSYKHDTAAFVPVKSVPVLAYDHNEMLSVALKRLRAKLGYTTIAQYLLPPTFTLTELQTVYELVLGKKFDKRNFRKKILALNIVKETGKMQEGVKNRPAALYTFAKKQLVTLSLEI